VPDAGKMHFMHSDQQIFFSGGGPRHPAWTSQLRYSQGRAPPDMVPSAPQAKNPSYAPGRANKEQLRGADTFGRHASAMHACSRTLAQTMTCRPLLRAEPARAGERSHSESELLSCQSLRLIVFNVLR